MGSAAPPPHPTTSQERDSRKVAFEAGPKQVIYGTNLVGYDRTHNTVDFRFTTACEYGQYLR